MLRKQLPIPLCDSRDSSYRVRAAQMMQETALARGAGERILLGLSSGPGAIRR